MKCNPRCNPRYIWFAFILVLVSIISLVDIDDRVKAIIILVSNIVGFVILILWPDKEPSKPPVKPPVVEPPVAEPPVKPPVAEPPVTEIMKF